MNTQIELLKKMMQIRAFEELSRELYTQEKIRGFLHLYSGQEAVAVGVLQHLTLEDNVVATYREHAHALMKGLSVREVMAEMFGKVSGCSRGRGGSMHLFSKEKRFFGGNAIVASGISHAVGLSLAAKLLNENRHTVCFFGDGAVAEGDFHESLNMASLWSLPVLFCCENNFYAMGTALGRHQAQINLVEKVHHGYKIDSMEIDGMNVMEVFEGAKIALASIAKSGRPHFIEFKTYRFHSHSMFDPELYRKKDEVEFWKTCCPIEKLKKELLSGGYLDEEKLLLIQKDIEKKLQEAVEFAESARREEMSEALGVLR
jgi:pyruvate dehydrogenase E1 component alpha subunit